MTHLESSCQVGYVRVMRSSRTMAASERESPQAEATPLARELAGEGRARATPVEAFQLARHKWLAGERIDIGALARELGVGRATMFRWVGSRELLLGEIIWSMQAPIMEKARAETKGRGAAYVASVCERIMET